MSLINTQAPQWSGTAYHNGEFVDVSSKDYEGKWAIIFFYPADFTYVCPTELEDMAENYDELSSLGVEVYSFSTDKHYTHKAWHETSDRIAKIKEKSPALLNLWTQRRLCPPVDLCDRSQWSDPVPGNLRRGNRSQRH